MIEVFMIGVLVTVVKLSTMAQVLPGVALWSFGALVVVLAAMLSFDPRDFGTTWSRRRRQRRRAAAGARAMSRHPPHRAQPARPSHASNSAVAARGRRRVAELTDDDERTPLAECTTRIARLAVLPRLRPREPIALEGEPCPRCGATLHRRKPASLARTWAFLLAAYILYIPANLLPVMVTESILGTQRDTIMSGVLYLWLSGSHMLAGVVLIASIVVPLLKMMILTLLLISVQLKSTWRIRQQTRCMGWSKSSAAGRCSISSWWRCWPRWCGRARWPRSSPAPARWHLPRWS
jgi:paraquat-inducible protein A